MQVRKVPIISSLLIALALLFGGWFLFQKVEIEEPVRTKIAQMESATLADLQITKEQMLIKLTVTKPEDFPEEYKSLENDISGIVKNKEVIVELTNQNEELKKVWNNGTFALTEALELHQYSKLPALVNEWKVKNQLDLALTSMDKSNIYIFLKRGSDEFYTIVPREQQESEVNARG
ncbi:hypothetical protein [Brevibacillus sp. SYSU BS000544]|uniref:hypothetical protein n=1 Tax=Brevibacillus sp. SYSU BS000544 TaxID=3416443 RepID=UPI003CE51153